MRAPDQDADLPRPSVATVQFHFLEGWFDMRDFGGVLDHEGALPHPTSDQRQWPEACNRFATVFLFL